MEEENKIQPFQQDAELEEDNNEEEIIVNETDTTPLTLDWVIGYNMDMIMGVHDLTTKEKNVLYNCRKYSIRQDTLA